VHPVLFHIGAVLIPSYGAVAALGVLLALALTQRTARIVRVDPAKLWNLCILSLFAALAAARLLLVAANWSALRSHPAWLLGLAMVHHPLLAGVGALAGAGCAAWYARWSKLPFRATADALAPPLALGLAFEQLGALAAGSDYGTEAGPGVPWAVTYTHTLAAIWSGTPLGIPLHPVQVYAAMMFLALAILLWVWLPLERRQGDVAGLWLMGTGVVIYLTELWRDPEGRGSLFQGAIDGPQIAAVLLVLAGALVLRDRKRVSRAAPDTISEHAAPSGESREST
jgi:phosphatidylglycerol:prolipoprotein diacylglycerol transferase